MLVSYSRTLRSVPMRSQWCTLATLPNIKAKWRAATTWSLNLKQTQAKERCSGLMGMRRKAASMSAFQSERPTPGSFSDKASAVARIAFCRRSRVSYSSFSPGAVAELQPDLPCKQTFRAHALGGGEGHRQNEGPTSSCHLSGALSECHRP